jgi:hypothetical protein
MKYKSEVIYRTEARQAAVKRLEQAIFTLKVAMQNSSLVQEDILKIYIDELSRIISLINNMHAN